MANFAVVHRAAPRRRGRTSSIDERAPNMREEDWKRAASEAMDRYADGDDAAFEIVFDLIAPRLTAFFVRRARNREDAEELVSETFVKMHLARRHFTPEGDVMPWVYAIARNLWIDELRRRQARGAVVTDAHKRVELEDPGPSAHALVEREQLGVLIARALAKLNAPLREAFELVQLDELSIREAAAAVGCTETAMKLRAFRSYEALRAELGERAGRFEGKRT